jgi:hypothetical protein
MKTTSSVVVVYEGEMTREVAVSFCDHLVERFWNRCGFDVSWWSFGQLESQRSALQAAERAIEADLIVFATRPEGEIPLAVHGWMESWLGQRGDREGALVDLTERRSGDYDETARHLYLRKIAHRAGMDYLTQLPENISRPIPDSLESYSERADQVGSVMEEILHQNPPPRSYSQIYS